MSWVATQAGLVLALTLLAYGLAYVRDAVIAAYLGTSAAADAYFVAMVIPLMLFQVTVTGMLVPAFQPVMIQYLVSGRVREGWRVVSVVAHFLLLALVLLTLLGLAAAPGIIRLLAPGLSPATTALAVDLLRLMFPMLIFMGFAGLIGAILNALDHFAFPALGPAVGYGVVLIGLFLAVPHWGPLGLALATVFGAAAHLMVLLPVLASKRPQYVPSLDYRHPGVRQVGRLSFPLFLFLLQAQVTPIVERNFGSTLPEGSIAVLNYAMKLYNLPNIVFAASIVTVLGPSFARYAAQQDLAELRRTVSQGISAILFFAIPAAVWLGVNGLALVRFLYERGNFRLTDSILTATVLSAYALGIAPAGIYALVVRAFHSLQDMVTPLIVGLATTTIYVPLSYLLTSHLHLIGLPLSLSLITWLALILSLWLLQRRIGGLDRELIPAPSRMLLASALMGGVCWLWQNTFLATRDVLSLQGSFVSLMSSLGIGVLTYGATGWALGLPEMGMVRVLIRRYLNRGADGRALNRLLSRVGGEPKT